MQPQAVYIEMESNFFLSMEIPQICSFNLFEKKSRWACEQSEPNCSVHLQRVGELKIE